MLNCITSQRFVGIDIILGNACVNKPLRIGPHLKYIINSLEQTQMTESWLVSKNKQQKTTR